MFNLGIVIFGLYQFFRMTNFFGYLRGTGLRCPVFFPDFIVYPQLEVWFYTYPLPSRGFTAPNITPLKPPSPKPIPPPNNRIKPTLHPQHQRPNPPLKHKRSCYPPPPVGDQEQPRPRRHSTRRVNRVPFPSNPRRQPERARVQEQVRRPGVELCSAAAEVPGAPVEEEAREGCGEGVEGGFWIVSFDRQGAGGGGDGWWIPANFRPLVSSQCASFRLCGVDVGVGVGALIARKNPGDSLLNASLENFSWWVILSGSKT
jgi:hypothetical protein